MNKKLAKNGSTLNKNMTNTNSLNLTSKQCTSSSFITCNRNYIKSNKITCSALDLPISIPTIFFPGTVYYNIVTQTLRIYDRFHWYQIQLTQVP